MMLRLRCSRSIEEIASATALSLRTAGDPATTRNVGLLAFSYKEVQSMW